MDQIGDVYTVYSGILEKQVPPKSHVMKGTRQQDAAENQFFLKINNMRIFKTGEFWGVEKSERYKNLKGPTD